VTAGAVAVLVVDPSDAAVPGVAVTFREGTTTTTLTTGPDGRVSRALPHGGDVVVLRDAGQLTVVGVANGDVIHAGPDPAVIRAAVSASVTVPAALDASSAVARFGACGDARLGEGTPPIALRYPLDLAVTPSPLAASLETCVTSDGRVEASFVASDAVGAPIAAALVDIGPEQLQGSVPVNVGAGDFRPVTVGTASISGTVPTSQQTGAQAEVISFASRVDFPTGRSFWAGAESSISSGDFAYFLPPASVAPQILASTMIVRREGTATTLGSRAVSAHVRRLARTTSLTDDRAALLPLLSWESGSTLLFDAPLPTDAVGYFAGRQVVVFPVAKGATRLALPYDDGFQDWAVAIFSSAQISYALARQYPTVLGDPYMLFAALAPDGQADVLYDTLMLFPPEP
jgi:hypothetical protein